MVKFKTITRAGMQFITWDEYLKHVKEIEDDGATTSDAQGVVDAQLMIQKIGVIDETN